MYANASAFEQKSPVYSLFTVEFIVCASEP